MPLLDPTAEAVLLGLVSLVYGIRWERYYTAWISVVMNVVFTIILFASTEFPAGFVWVVLVYIALGIVTLWRTLRRIFWLFGTKTFGALSLTVAFAQSGNIGWTSQVISALNLSASEWLSYGGLQYLVGWVLVTAIVQIVGLLFSLRWRYTEDDL